MTLCLDLDGGVLINAGTFTVGSGGGFARLQSGSIDNAGTVTLNGTLVRPRRCSW